MKLSTLYVSRWVLNGGEELAAWAHSVGFKKALKPRDFHVTLAFCPKIVDWDALGQHTDPGIMLWNEASNRKLISLDHKATAMSFDNNQLWCRWKDLVDKGVHWDYNTYQPHITISYEDCSHIDLVNIKPFTGDLFLGPEIFRELQLNWVKKITEN